MSTPSPTGLLTIEQQADVTMVRLHPRIMEASWEEIDQAAAEVVEVLTRREKPRYLMDLSQLRHLGSAQLAFLVHLWKSVQERDGQCVVCCPRDDVREIISLAGLHRLWTVVPELEAARRQLSGSRGGGRLYWGSLVCWLGGGLGLATGLAGLMLKAQLDLHGKLLAPALSYGGGAAAAAAGLVICLIDRGARKGGGIGLLAAGAAIAAAGYWWR